MASTASTSTTLKTAYLPRSNVYATSNLNYLDYKLAKVKYKLYGLIYDSPSVSASVDVETDRCGELLIVSSRMPRILADRHC